MKTATVTVHIEGQQWDYSGTRSVSVTEEAHYDSDVARLLVRIAKMIDPNVLAEK